MGFYKFSLADMDNCSTSTDSAEVKVSLYVNSTGTAASTVNWQFYKVEDYSWLENSITWNNKPLVSNGIVASITGFDNATGVYNASNRLTFDISNAAWLQYKAGKKLISFNATQSAKAAGGAGATNFTSKECLDPQQLPYITIKRIPKKVISTVTPEVADGIKVFSDYPNNAVKIYTPSLSKYRITDIQGRTIQKGSLGTCETKTVSLSSCIKGVYLLSLGDKVFKIIRE
jgi:hypothetical protein